MGTGVLITVLFAFLSVTGDAQATTRRTKVFHERCDDSRYFEQVVDQIINGGYCVYPSRDDDHRIVHMRHARRTVSTSRATRAPLNPDGAEKITYATPVTASSADRIGTIFDPTTGMTFTKIPGLRDELPCSSLPADESDAAQMTSDCP